MANTITKSVNDLQATIDFIYKKESVTGVLEMNNILVQPLQTAGSVRIAKRTIDGYGDYGRENGGSAYPSGDVTQTWETKQMTVDRGVELTVDRLDNDETAENAFLSLASMAGQLEREHGAPEMDAYRFATMAGTSGILTTTAADLTSSTVKAAVDAAIAAQDDAEVPDEGRILFMSTSVYNAFKNAGLFTYNLKSDGENDGVRDTRFVEYDGHRVIKVPQSRFYTAIDLNDGSSTFGYAKAAGGVNINFMIVHPSAVAPVSQLAQVKYFDPDTNQRGDSHLVQARKYYDLFVMDNKVEGIYLHKATA